MDTTEPTTIKFKYTASDAVSACRLYRRSTSRIVVRLIAVVLFISACLLLYVDGLYWFNTVLFLLAFAYWFDPITPARTWLGFTMNAKLYSEPYEATYDDEGAHTETGTYTVHRTWDAYSAVLENDRLFLLVYGHWLYGTVPKRAFSSEEDIRTFREMLRRKIGKTELGGKRLF